MASLRAADTGGMTFVPLLETTENPDNGGEQIHRFRAKVRFKGEGMVAPKKYHNAITGRQRQSITVLRPYMAARGLLPVIPSSRRPLPEIPSGRRRPRR